MKSKISRQLLAIAVALVTPARNSPATAESDTGQTLQNLVRLYQQRRRPITVNFRRILPALNSADRFTHLIHPYPAKLLVHIPFFFLANDLLSEPGHIV